MPILAKQLAQASLTTEVTVLYVSPDGVLATLLKDINLANHSDAAVAVSLYIVPAAGDAGPGNIFLPGVEVPAHGIAGWFGTQVLPLGAAIAASATAAGVTLTASGAQAS